MMPQIAVRRPFALSVLLRLSLMTMLLIGQSISVLSAPAAASAAAPYADKDNRSKTNEARSLELRASSAPLLLPPGPGSSGGTGWKEGKIGAASDAGNRRGQNPVYENMEDLPHPLEDNGGAGSANFQFTVPILSVPGRGLDLNLALHYNARIWYKSGGKMFFAPDADWPALGWSLGFGYVEWAVDSDNVVHYIIIDSDGTRHDTVHARITNSDGSVTSVGHTTDGTFVDYTVEYGPERDATVTVLVKYPNGTMVEYRAGDNSDCQCRWYPTKITDANGNFIEIKYWDNKGPRITKITDTLGRVFVFYYAGSVNLTAIEGPGLNGSRRVLVHLLYDHWLLSYHFAPGLIKNNCKWGRCVYPEIDVKTIKAVYFPGFDTGYWFGDRDSYSGFGMLRIVSERRGMSFSSTLPEQGNVTPGVETRNRTYDYPQNEYNRYEGYPYGWNQPDASSTLRDAPEYHSMTETWMNMDTPPAVTRYDVWPRTDGTPRQITVTYPDGSKSIQVSYCSEGAWYDGLVYNVTTMDANNKIVNTIVTSWEPGAGGSVRVHRVSTVDATRHRAVEYIYGPERNQVKEVLEYDYDGTTVLRRTQVDYETDPNYSTRHIFNLPKSVRVYEGSSSVPALLTEYAYDADTEPLMDTPGIYMHSILFDPIRAGTREIRHEVRTDNCLVWDEECNSRGVCGLICEEYEIEVWFETIHLYDENLSAWRGNITEIRRYADAANRQGALTENRHYDIAGNLVSVSTMPGEPTRWVYTASTQYAYPELVTGSVRLRTLTVYDYSTGLPLYTQDANGPTTRTYDPDTLLLGNVLWPTGATTGYLHDLSSFSIWKTDWDASGDYAGTSIVILNGRGLPIGQISLLGNLPANAILTKYDALGRVWKQTLPHRGDQTPQWNETAYDALGRVVLTRAADGSTQSQVYDESGRPDAASTKPGQTVRTSDAWGRERWMRYNALGQLEEVVMPNPARPGVMEPGSVATTYRYDALGDLVETRQGPLPQVRKFRYDSLGRLTHQYLPEKLPTLDEAGRYGGTGAQWSDVYIYDAVGNQTAHVDARGVKTVYDYGNDPLRRVHRITFEMPQFSDPANPIMPSATVFYSYRNTGDRNQLQIVSTEGIGSETFTYDDHSRLETKTLVVYGAHNGALPLVLKYTPDSLNRLATITYPAEYGVPAAPAKELVYSFGIGNHVSSATFGGQLYASSLTYNAAGQVTSGRIGPSGPNQPVETYDYDPQTGLLQHQNVARGGNSLLDLTYDYLLAPGKVGRSGQVTKVIDNLDHAGNRSYFYDGWGRLGKAVRRYFWEQLYKYDRYGNRTSVTALGPSPECDPTEKLPCPLPQPKLPSNMQDGIGTVSYDAQKNRITLPGYTYDAAGNQTRAQRADGSWQGYQYDAAGRLVKVTNDSGGVLETYTYAGAGNQRIMTQYGGTGSGGRRYYVWDGSTVIAEYGTGAEYGASLKWAKSYVYLGSRLLATLTPDATGSGEMVQYHHPNRLGTGLITNGENSITSQNQTFPYGVDKLGNPMGATNQRFTSYDRSVDTGLDYAVNRFYDPWQGRFMQPDPLGIAAASLANPQSLNMYSYVGNDPVNVTDPLGLKDDIKARCEVSGGFSICYNGANERISAGLAPSGISNGTYFADGSYQAPGDSGGRAGSSGDGGAASSGGPNSLFFLDPFSTSEWANQVEIVMSGGAATGLASKSPKVTAAIAVFEYPILQGLDWIQGTFRNWLREPTGGHDSKHGYSSEDNAEKLPGGIAWPSERDAGTLGLPHPASEPGTP